MSAEGFRAELERLINRESREGGSNTPDFILADYLATCLEAFDKAATMRDDWYGVELRPGLCLAAAATPSPETGTAAVPTKETDHAKK